MENFKLRKLGKNELKVVNGGFRQCLASGPNQGCGPNECCIGSACHPISDSGHQWGYCNAPTV
ncbi:hypothetical protein AAEU33_19670 [Chryseobacterium sp. Chry.R1]|uniref:hypothetical protein n=1 Tax=Chryseobacterium sp. Chry.R1 TaxID=3139392 RepID=UPI0031F921F0